MNDSSSRNEQKEFFLFTASSQAEGFLMQVREILGDKGHTVYCCGPNDSLADVVDLLVGYN